MTLPAFEPIATIAAELAVPPRSVQAVLALLADGNTVPFIARYRKEATGELDEVQIRDVAERNAYLQELHDRKATILATIEQQGKLTDDLRQRILTCDQKAELEDLYLPYRPKRRTRATKARERGLQPLADLILQQPLKGSAADAAAPFVNPELEVPTAEDALQGARDIIAEQLAETAAARALIRDTMLQTGRLTAAVDPKKEEEAAKFRDYFAFDEAVRDIPSHRYLAVRRGEREGFLNIRIQVEAEPVLRRLLLGANHNPASPLGAQLQAATEDAWKRLLQPSLEGEVLTLLKDRADEKAIEVFAENLKNLLLASPAGPQPILALDPGFRTGCKVAVVADTGQFLENRTLYIIGSDAAQAKSRRELVELVRTYKPFAITIGNGTASRESETFVKETLRAAEITGVLVVMVNESGASVYSASDIAREEFPDLDLTVRGAISIGRRFQDPLAELVKLDPKVIGVGQYQHDVNQNLLTQKLSDVVESSVNLVGVELNTASAPLLTYVSGIGPRIAQRIIERRQSEGPFTSRAQLLKIAGLGAKTYQQAAGFIRVRESKHPLDASAVHPERYALVEQIAKDLGVKLGELLGNDALISQIELKRYVSEEVGEVTLRDILAELRKPGRDPRATFEPPAFRDDVHSIADLKTGMKLEGVVTNVTAFGAFVDIGVHQDGLVHISQLADRFVKDPHEVVKVGQRLQVTVMEVDVRRSRIGLSARSAPEAGARPAAQEQGGGRGDDRNSRGGNNRSGGGGRRDDRRDDRRDKSPAPAPAAEPFSNPFAKLKR